MPFFIEMSLVVELPDLIMLKTPLLHFFILFIFLMFEIFILDIFLFKANRRYKIFTLQVLHF